MPHNHHPTPPYQRKTPTTPTLRQESGQRVRLHVWIVDDRGRPRSWCAPEVHDDRCEGDLAAARRPPLACPLLADSRGGCNTCNALSSSSSRCLGVSQFSVLRGRLPCWSAMAPGSASVRSDRSVPLGIYWRNSPFVFSLVPRLQGECGSQTYTSRPSCEPILRCWASSLPCSQVSGGARSAVSLRACR